MSIWRSLAREVILCLFEAALYRVVFGLVAAGAWLRDHRLMPDLWFREQSTRMILWMVTRGTR
jgi:hypothetical protein